jgi:hypothetical protein
VRRRSAASHTEKKEGRRESTQCNISTKNIIIIIRNLTQI